MNGSIQSDMKRNAIPGFSTKSKGDLAIITGGSSGIGLAFALKAAQCGMLPVIIDKSVDKFKEIDTRLRQAGAPNVVCIECDVSSWVAMQAIGVRVKHEFGEKNIGLICANAGYTGSPLIGGLPGAIKQQVDVNLNGVIWTFKAFQKQFLEQKKPCALVGTSSIAGVLNAKGSYGVTKHGNLAVMEALYSELFNMGPSGSHVKTYVLCPGVVSTNIAKATESMKIMETQNKIQEAYGEAFKYLLEEKGMSAAYIAEKMFEGVESGRFYMIVDHPKQEMSIDVMRKIVERQQRMTAGAPPKMGASDADMKGFYGLLMKQLQRIIQDQTKAKL